MDNVVRVRFAMILAILFGVLSSSQASADWARNFGPVNPIAELERSIEEFTTAQKKASENANLVPDYVQAGLTMSNVACDAWLVSLGKSDRDVGFFKNMLNIVGNLIIGISGINGASPSSLARGALALGASNASIDAYRNDFLMGVASDIETKVKSGRKLSEQMLLETGPVHYQEAKRRLLEYHDQCTPTAIKELLKTSLAQVAYARPDVTLGREINEARASLLAAQLYAAMYPAGQPPYSFSSDDLYKLWVVTIALPADHPSATVKSYKASGDIQVLKKDFDGKNTSGQLYPLLKQIAEYLNFAKRLEGELVKEGQLAEGAQEADAKRRLDAATDEVQRSEQALDAARDELLKLEARLVGDTRSGDSATKDEASKLLRLIQQVSESHDARGSSVRSSLSDLPASPSTLEVRERMDAIAKSLETLAEDRDREQRALAMWNRAVATRPPTISFSRPVSITPVIVPVR